MLEHWSNELGEMHLRVNGRSSFISMPIPMDIACISREKERIGHRQGLAAWICWSMMRQRFQFPSHAQKDVQKRKGEMQFSCRSSLSVETRRRSFGLIRSFLWSKLTHKTRDRAHIDKIVCKPMPNDDHDDHPLIDHLLYVGELIRSI